MVSCDLGGGFVIDRRNDPTQHWGLFKIADVFIRFQYLAEFWHLGFLNIDKEIGRCNAWEVLFDGLS